MTMGNREEHIPALRATSLEKGKTSPWPSRRAGSPQSGTAQTQLRFAQPRWTAEIQRCVGTSARPWMSVFVRVRPCVRAAAAETHPGAARHPSQEGMENNPLAPFSKGEFRGEVRWHAGACPCVSVCVSAPQQKHTPRSPLERGCGSMVAEPATLPGKHVAGCRACFNHTSEIIDQKCP